MVLTAVDPARAAIELNFRAVSDVRHNVRHHDRGLVILALPDRHENGHGLEMIARNKIGKKLLALLRPHAPQATPLTQFLVLGPARHSHARPAQPRPRAPRLPI